MKARISSQLTIPPIHLSPRISWDSDSLQSSPNIEATQHRFQKLKLCFARIDLLCQLAKAVQQHRGATMAFLGGEGSFEALIESLQARIETLLHLLQSMEQSPDAMNGFQAIDHIGHDWQTILRGWNSDQIMHNFEFHSHLVASVRRLLLPALNQQLAALASAAQIIPQTRAESFYPLIFDTIESLAMLRGLSTNAAVISSCGADSHTRLEYLLKLIPQMNESLQTALQSFSQQFQATPMAQIRGEQRMELHRFLISIRMAVLEQHPITAGSTELFQLSTGVIDAYWLTFDKGIRSLEITMLDQLLDGHPS